MKAGDVIYINNIGKILVKEDGAKEFVGTCTFCGKELNWRNTYIVSTTKDTSVLCYECYEKYVLNVILKYLKRYYKLLRTKEEKPLKKIINILKRILRISLR